MSLLTIIRLRLIRLLNWRLVRSLAELQILSRVSYFMLIFVPLLAGLWPAVRYYVNNHNEAIVEATEILEEQTVAYKTAFDSLSSTFQADYLDSQTQEYAVTVINKVEAVADSFNEDIADFTEDFIPKTIEEPKLPWTWGAAFFAALFSVIAHLFYQLRAPEILKKFTNDEFVKYRKEDYAAHASEEALERAKQYLATKEGVQGTKIEHERIYRLYKKIHADLFYDTPYSNSNINPVERLVNFNLSDLTAIQSLLIEQPDLPDAPKMLNFVNEAYARNTKSAGITDVEKQKQMTVIERGANAEYLYWASKNRFMALLSTVFYSAAVIVLLDIIFIQSQKVLVATGWENIFELLRFAL